MPIRMLTSRIPPHPLIANSRSLCSSIVPYRTIIGSGLRTLSNRVRLQRRRRNSESVELATSRADGADTRPAGDVHFEAASALYLGNEIHVCQRRRVPDAVVAVVPISSEQRLDRVEAGGNPGRAPSVDPTLVATERPTQIFEDTAIVHWMNGA